MFADSNLPVSSVPGSSNNENVWQFGAVQGSEGLDSEMKKTNQDKEANSEDIFGELSTPNGQKEEVIVDKIATNEATENDDQSTKRYDDKEEHSARENISADSLREH